MKLFPSLFLLALNVCLFTGPAWADDAATKLPPAAADKTWNVAGPWFFMHSLWSGSMILAADGSLLDAQNRLDGQWSLTTEQGEVHLLIRWKDWPTDDLKMINSNEFYGKNDRAELRARRVLPAPQVNAGQESGGPVETRAWHQGEPAVKLIRQEEGFCALTSVTGNFQGNGERVRVYVAEDGYWYLAGVSHQEGVAAECIVVRYRK